MDKQRCIIETEKLSYSYGNHVVFENLNIQVPYQSIYGFLGPNGAGKTTTIRLLLNLLKVNKPKITVFGKDIDTNRMEILSKTGSMIEAPSLYKYLTGYQNLDIMRRYLNLVGLYNFTSSSDGWKGPKTDPLVIKTGTWQHVAIVHDEAAKTTKIYVDGVEKAVSTEMDAPNNSGWSEMWLGNGWGKMDGYIKDFRLWDVARPSAQLDADITGTEDGLQAYFPLSKVNGVKFDDVTGNYKGEMRGIDWNTSN